MSIDYWSRSDITRINDSNHLLAKKIYGAKLNKSIAVHQYYDKKKMKHKAIIMLMILVLCFICITLPLKIEAQSKRLPDAESNSTFFSPFFFFKKKNNFKGRMQRQILLISRRRKRNAFVKAIFRCCRYWVYSQA